MARKKIGKVENAGVIDTVEKTVEEVKTVAVEKAKSVKKAAQTKSKEVKEATGKAVKAVASKSAVAKAEVYVQYLGNSFSTKEIVEKAIAAYKAENAKAAIKTLEVYVKPEESAAYYVVNGDGKPEYKVEL